MKLKLFLISLLFVILSFFTIDLYDSKVFATDSNNQAQVILENTFVRVLIDGEWWIIEYGEDGGIVSVIKEPNY